jgi:hypothetical protein
MIEILTELQNKITQLRASDPADKEDNSGGDAGAKSTAKEGDNAS